MNTTEGLKVLHSQGKFKVEIFDDKFSGHSIKIQTNGFQWTVISVDDIEQLVKANECISE